MAQLTGDQRTTISDQETFRSRVAVVLKMKAEYWQESATPARSDVNRRMQKRKRLARQILNSTFADQIRTQAAQHWLAYYQTANPVLDGNGVPTYDEIFNNFDPTWDFFAGVTPGDELVTEIEW